MKNGKNNENIEIVFVDTSRSQNPKWIQDLENIDVPFPVGKSISKDTRPAWLKALDNAETSYISEKGDKAV